MDHEMKVNAVLDLRLEQYNNYKYTCAILYVWVVN